MEGNWPRGTDGRLVRDHEGAHDVSGVESVSEKDVVTPVCETTDEQGTVQKELVGLPEQIKQAVLAAKQQGAEQEQPLKINLGQFGNNDFETGNSGDTTISGWSTSNSQIKLNGTSSLGGQPTATDTVFPDIVATGSAAPHDQMTPSRASYSTELSSDTSSGSGLSVKLRSYSVTVDSYGILHGPAIVSDSTVKLHPGDSVSFEWRASGGQDAYDVIGYLVDENTGHIEEILNETGADANASTNWATVTKNISTSGT